MPNAVITLLLCTKNVPEGLSSREGYLPPADRVCLCECVCLCVNLCVYVPARYIGQFKRGYILHLNLFQVPMVLGFDEKDHDCRFGGHKPNNMITFNDFKDIVQLESLNNLFKRFSISPILQTPLILSLIHI